MTEKNKPVTHVNMTFTEEAMKDQLMSIFAQQLSPEAKEKFFETAMQKVLSERSWSGGRTLLEQTFFEETHKFARVFFQQVLETDPTVREKVTQGLTKALSRLMTSSNFESQLEEVLFRVLSAGLASKD